MKALYTGATDAILSGIESQHPRRLETTIRDLSKAVESIFPDLQAVTSIDKPYADTRRAWDEIVTSVDDDIVLFYYNGHAYLTRDGADLAFSFPGSDLKFSEHLTVGQIVEIARTKPSNKYLFIFDCCHGQISEKNLIPISDICYCISASSEGYAFNGPEGSYFTKELISALDFRRIRMDDLRIDRAARAVTWRRVFEHSERQFNLRSHGVPKLFRQRPRDFGKLGHLSLHDFPISVPDALNVGAYRNTIYYKLFVILQIIADEPRLSERALYQKAKKHKSGSFIIQNNDNGKRFVGAGRFSQFLAILASLDIVEEPTRNISLTSVGERAASEDLYNSTLTRQIFEKHFPEGYDEVRFYDDIVHLMRECNVASPRNVLKIIRSIDPSAGGDYAIFRDCFSLLGYTQLFGRAPIGSIFPKLFGFR